MSASAASMRGEGRTVQMWVDLECPIHGSVRVSGAPHRSNAEWVRVRSEHESCPLPVGTPVNYHGSLTDEHGSYVVTGFDRNTATYSIEDPDYPGFGLKQVSPDSITWFHDEDEDE